MYHFNITVAGKVQGVWYRGSTQKQAHQIGITGYVKNLKNGDVFIEAEGTKEQLNKLLEWCKTGLERAKVTAVEFEEKEIQDFTNFKIKRF